MSMLQAAGCSASTVQFLVREESRVGSRLDQGADNQATQRGQSPGHNIVLHITYGILGQTFYDARILHFLDPFFVNVAGVMALGCIW